MKIENDKQKDFWSEISKKPPFEVPENYFEEFESRLQYRLNEDKQANKPRVIQLIKPAIGLAAGFLLIFMFVYYPLNIFFPSLSSSTEEQEIDFTLESLNEDYFYDMLSEDFHADSLKQEEIIDYLAVEMNDYELYEMYN